MKKQLNTWSKRILAAVVLIIGLLVLIVLNPELSYAHKTSSANFSIYHNQKLDPSLVAKLTEAYSLLKTSEFYSTELKLDICLNDPSFYPTLIEKIQGPGFAWGFYNKVVINGTINGTQNTVELNKYRWNLTQLLAHEMTHCLQFQQLGFWKSNPVASIPIWKWEGYAEYIARQNPSQQNLIENIRRFQKADSTQWSLPFNDGTIAPLTYYKYWLLVQYCLEIKKMSYAELLENDQPEAALTDELMKWYADNNKDQHSTQKK